MARRRLTVQERAARAAKFELTAPQTRLHQANNPDRLDLIFLALSNRHRRLMLTRLTAGPATVTELASLAMATFVHAWIEKREKI